MNRENINMENTNTEENLINQEETNLANREDTNSNNQDLDLYKSQLHDIRMMRDCSALISQYYHALAEAGKVHPCLISAIPPELQEERTAKFKTFFEVACRELAQHFNSYNDLAFRAAKEMAVRPAVDVCASSPPVDSMRKLQYFFGSLRNIDRADTTAWSYLLQTIESVDFDDPEVWFQVRGLKSVNSKFWRFIRANDRKRGKKSDYVEGLLRSIALNEISAAREEELKALRRRNRAARRSCRN
jgi:hypothetical protein